MAPADILSAYRLAAGDSIRVVVWGQNDLTTEATIGTGCSVAMPLIGAVTAIGRTAPEIRQEIAQRLGARYLVDPDVRLEVMEYRPFFIQGQVARPGRYAYSPALDLRQAVLLAGGYTDRARPDALTIIRDTGERRVELRAEPASSVLPGDVIDVPRSGS